MRLDSGLPHTSFRCANCISTDRTARSVRCTYLYWSVQLNISIDSLVNVLTSRTYQLDLLRIRCALTIIMGSRRCGVHVYHVICIAGTVYQYRRTNPDCIAEIIIGKSAGRDRMLATACCLLPDIDHRRSASSQVRFPFIGSARARAATKQLNLCCTQVIDNRRRDHSICDIIPDRCVYLCLSGPSEVRDITMKRSEVPRWKCKCTQGCRTVTVRIRRTFTRSCHNSLKHLSHSVPVILGHFEMRNGDCDYIGGGVANELGRQHERGSSRTQLRHWA